jgi:AcrR family transcriptional regulator
MTERAELRQRLEDVAAELFAQHGYSATTVDDIVERAGVSKPALYRHFESKKDLYLTLLRRHREELATAALAEVGADRNLDSWLPAMIEAWFRHVEEHPYTWRMLFRDVTGDPDVQAVHAEVARAQRAADVVLLRRVVPPFPDAELEPLGEVVRSSLTGLALWWLEHPDTPRSVLVAAMLRVTRSIIASTQETQDGRDPAQGLASTETKGRKAGAARTATTVRATSSQSR